MPPQKNLFADFKLPIHPRPSRMQIKHTSVLDDSEHSEEVSPLEASDEEVAEGVLRDVQETSAPLKRGRSRTRKPAHRDAKAQPQADATRKPIINDYTKDKFNTQTRAYLKSAVRKNDDVYSEILYDENSKDDIRRLVLTISTGLDVWLQILQEAFPEDVPKFYRLTKRLRKHLDRHVDIGEINV